MGTRLADIAKEVEEEIKDKNLKELIFKNDVVDAADVKGIDVLYRMLVFAFTFSLAKYKYDMREGNIHTTFPNAERVFESFSCIFNGEDVGLDLIIYILTEIQLDVLNHDRRSYFYGIFGNREDSIQIPMLRGVIKTWLHSAKFAEKDNAKLAQYFSGLYHSLDLLRNVEVIHDGDAYSFRYLPTDVVIPGFGLICTDEEKNLYYLNSYEVVENNLARLTYHSVDGGEVLRTVLPLKEFKENSYITNNETAPKSIFAKSLFSLDFKYIKNLSLSVSDTITKATKEKFYENYSRKHGEVFEQLGYRCFEDVNWDNVLTILMLEEGPSELLEFILDSDGFYFEKILHNLEIRYNKAGFADHIKTTYETMQHNQMELVRRYLDDKSSIVKNIIAINRTLMAKSIIDGLAELERSAKRSNTQFVESLPMRIHNIDKVIMSDESMESKVIKINKALEKTFRHIIPFYYGLIAYQECKEDIFSRIDMRGMNSADGEVDKQALLAKCEERFYEVAAAKSAEISRLAIGQLIELFIRFAASLVRIDGHKTVVSEKGKLLKGVIGRSYLCSVRTLRSIISMQEDGFDRDVSDGAKGNMASFINSIKHFKPGDATVNIVTFKRFLFHVKQLLYFLIYNEDYQREMVLGQQISYDPIYPYVVRYSERSENRDGYNINSFAVFYTEDTGEKEIKILSERAYMINEKYYCIPNVTTSNNRWWIEPFLISCRRYDSIVNSTDPSTRQEEKDEPSE